MGLGAMAMTSEKAEELKNELLQKGQKLYDKGVIANEELKHNIKETIKDNVTIITTTKANNKNDLIEKLKKMSPEDRKDILEALMLEKE